MRFPTRIFTASLIILFAGSAISTATQAEQGSAHGPASFTDFDLNGDGVISEAEFNEGHAKRMSEMAAEGRQMKHAGDAPGFSGIDSNENGEISKDEFATHQAEHHSKMKQGKHQ
jgi:Ca2+-binding EF-hand superfamily protein